MKISARNAFKATIEIVSVITTNSAKRLKLKVGSKAYAIIKADSVVVGVD